LTDAIVSPKEFVFQLFIFLSFLLNILRSWTRPDATGDFTWSCEVARRSLVACLYDILQLLQAPICLYLLADKNNDDDDDKTVAVVGQWDTRFVWRTSSSSSSRSDEERKTRSRRRTFIFLSLSLCVFESVVGLGGSKPCKKARQNFGRPRPNLRKFSLTSKPPCSLSEVCRTDWRNRYKQKKNRFVSPVRISKAEVLQLSKGWKSRCQPTSR
jgi:hypothetical protein